MTHCYKGKWWTLTECLHSVRNVKKGPTLSPQCSFKFDGIPSLSYNQRILISWSFEFFVLFLILITLWYIVVWHVAQHLKKKKGQFLLLNYLLLASLLLSILSFLLIILATLSQLFFFFFRYPFFCLPLKYLFFSFCPWAFSLSSLLLCHVLDIPIHLLNLSFLWPVLPWIYNFQSWICLLSFLKLTSLSRFWISIHLSFPKQEQSLSFILSSLPIDATKISLHLPIFFTPTVLAQVLVIYYLDYGNSPLTCLLIYPLLSLKSVLVWYF